MPKILSFGNREKKLAKANPFKFIWEWIQSLDKFTKFFLITIFLIAIVTPSIVTTYLIFTSRASSTIIPGDINERKSLVDLINTYRAQNGKNALTEDQNFTNAACWKSKNMADTGFYDHNDQNGRTFGQRLIDFGMDSREFALENLAVSDTSAQSVIDRWKNSPEHNTNLLSDGYWLGSTFFPLTRLGVGVAYNPNSQWKYYWTYDTASSYYQAINPLSSVSSDCSFSPVNQPPIGTTDSITNTTCRVQGWAFDPDASGTSIAIHVYRDGQAGSGAAGKSTYTANIPREPAVGNHGFDITFDPSGDAFDQGFFDDATHTIHVYAIDTAGGSNTYLGMTNNISRTINCSIPTPTPLPKKNEVRVIVDNNSNGKLDAGEGFGTPNVNFSSSIARIDQERSTGTFNATSSINNLGVGGPWTETYTNIRYRVTPAAGWQLTKYSSNKNLTGCNASTSCDYSSGWTAAYSPAAGETLTFFLGLKRTDSDGDGYSDEVEIYLGTKPNKACATGPEDIDATKPGKPSKTWPADLNTDGGIPATYNKVTLQDLTSFNAPIRRINTSPGDDFWVNGVHNQYDKRWDLVPGKGLFSKDINVQDITNMTILTPPMFGGQRAFNGPACKQ